MTTATDRARPTPGLVAKGSTVPVGAGPIGISITPGGCRAFVAYNGDGTVCVIDTVGSAGPVGIAPSRGAVTPNRLSSYMTDNGANAVSVLTSLRSVSPNQRPTRGDTLVAIAGINPAGATAARFGSPAAIIGSTRNQVTGIGPAGAGTVDGTVTTSAATGTPEPFRYVRPPPVPGVGLRPGPTTGGSTATAAGFAMTAGPAALTVPPQAAVGPVLAAVITAGGPATVLDYTHPDTSTVTAPARLGAGGRRAAHHDHGYGSGHFSHLAPGGAAARFTVISGTTPAFTAACPDSRPCGPGGHHRHRHHHPPPRLPLPGRTRRVDGSPARAPIDMLTTRQSPAGRPSRCDKTTPEDSGRDGPEPSTPQTRSRTRRTRVPRTILNTKEQQ